jgi:hypothetical protein
MERESLLWPCHGGGEGPDRDLRGENQQDQEPRIHGQSSEGAHAGFQPGQDLLSREGCRQHQDFPK